MNQAECLMLLTSIIATPLERAEACARFKELYEADHPETRQGYAGGRARRGAPRTPTFAEVLAQETKLSERAIRRDAQVAATLAPDVRDTLRAAPRAASLHELIALARLDVEGQRAAVERQRGRPGTGLAKAMRATGGAHVEELDFQAHVMLALGARADLRIWRQNVGSIAVRDRSGKIQRSFHAGPPKGASDLTGLVKPHGLRIEIELKADGKEPSEAQRHWRAMIEAFGGLYVVLAYDDALSLEANVDAAVTTVERAIASRRTVAA